MPDDQSSNSRANDVFASPVPAAIRRQSELADQIARAAGIANVPDARPADGEIPTVVNDPAAAPAEQQAQQPTEQPAAQPTERAPDRSQEQEREQQRYNTLKGKYDAEIPELQAQIRSLERVIAGIQSAPREREAPPARHDPAPTSYEISAEDREAYGEELITKSQAWAEAKLAPKLSRMEQRLLEIEGRSQQTQQQSAQQMVESQLDRAMPSWQVINQSPSFWAWLDQPDPFSGHLRRQLITDAHVRGDAARTLAFFQAYQREHTAVDPGAGTQPAQTGATQIVPTDRLPLENLAAPGRGSASQAAPGAPEKRLWTTAQVTALYREKTEGRWNGREDAFHRLEQDVIAAGREGRFRQ